MDKQPSLAEVYAGEALGIAWPAGAWPGEIGQQLILAQNVRRGWYHRPVVDYQTLPQAPRHRGHGQSIGWRRIPTVEEQRYAGAHAFDRSADYLAAAGAAMLPMGTPRYELGAQFDKQAGQGAPAGLWEAYVTYGESPWDGYNLPAVCPEGLVWLWTPSLRAAIACGYIVGTKAAILWSEQHKLLGTWAERIWAARRALEQRMLTAPSIHDDDEALYEAVQLVKSVYVITIGAFGQEPGEFPGTTRQERAADAGRTRDHMEHWQRPEWFCTIHAEALAYSFAVMRKAVERGCPPLWARLDTLGFVDSEGPTDAWWHLTAQAAGLFMREGALGAWRYDYPIPMSELLVTRGHDVEIPGRAERARLPAVRVRRESHG